MDTYTETFNTWDKVATAYEQKFMQLSIYNKSYKAFMELLPKDSTAVLDVGCGPGNVIKYMQSMRPNLNFLGIDISENMLSIATKHNPSAQFKIGDARELLKLNLKFDGVVAGFCLPYLSLIDRNNFVKEARSILKENGLLYLSFVEGKEELSGFQINSNGERMFFYYHQQKDLMTELIAENFKNIQVHKIMYRIGEEHTVLIAQRGI